MSYVPQDGDIVVAEFDVVRSCRGYDRITKRKVFGEVQRVTTKRVLVDTLRTGFLSFSRVGVWVPRASVVLGTFEQHEKWRKAIGECNELVRAIRDAHVADDAPEGEARP